MPKRCAPLLALALMGCREPAPARPPRSAPPVDAGCDGRARCARFGFESPAGRVTVPIVRARLGERLVYLVVDTGADTHVLRTALAHELALPTHVETLHDPDGGAAPVELAEPVDLVLDGGWRVPQRRIMVADLPARTGIDEMQVDGVLSPQLLAEGESRVVLELANHRMWLASPREATALGTRGATIGDVWPCVPSDEIASRHYWVGAEVGRPAGYQAVQLTSQIRLVLDTGRATTALYADHSAVAVLLDDHAGGYADLTLQLADARLEGSLVLGNGGPDSARCPSDGLLGLDVLAHCTVILGAKAGAVRCADAASPAVR